MSLMFEIKRVIYREEGFRKEPYLCSEGFVTIGYGTKLHNVAGQDPSEFCLQVSQDVAFAMFRDEVDRITDKLDTGVHSTTWRDLSTTRKAIIVSMAYQMGLSGLYKFKNMWAAMADGNPVLAGSEMLDSKWARQTPGRASRQSVAFAMDDLSEYM